MTLTLQLGTRDCDGW